MIAQWAVPALTLRASKALAVCCCIRRRVWFYPHVWYACTPASTLKWRLAYTAITHGRRIAPYSDTALLSTLDIIQCVGLGWRLHSWKHLKRTTLFTQVSIYIQLAVKYKMRTWSINFMAAAAPTKLQKQAAPAMFKGPILQLEQSLLIFNICNR